MKRILVICVAVWLVVSAHADNADDRQKIADNAEVLSTALASVETLYLEGIQNNTLAESLKKARQDMSVVREKAAWLTRKAHIKSSPGVNAAQLWRWGTVKDLNNALSEEIRSARPDFRVELEPDAGGDTALFVRRSTALFLQLPAAVHLQMKASTRKYGLFQDNFKALKESGRGKNILTNSVQWRGRAQTLLFYFWLLHKGREWVCEWPEAITHPAYFAQRQAEEVFKLAGCAFYAPKNSVIALDYGQRITALTEAAAVMSAFCQRDSKMRKLVRAFQDTEKLNVIWRRWNGRMDYLFYWSDAEVDSVDDLKPRLDEQMPLTKQYVTELRKEKEAKEKAAKEAKFSKKKKSDKPKDGEKVPEEKKAPPVKAKAPPPPEDPFNKAVYEYNLEIFIQAGEWRKDAREVEAFKADMITFARILARFREASAALHEQYPENLTRYNSGGSVRRTIPAGKRGSSRSR